MSRGAVVFALVLGLGPGLPACGGTPAPALDAACEPAVLYLNRTGGMFDHGGRDDSSRNLSEVVDGPRMMPPWPYDDVDWGLLVDCISASLAPFPVTITQADPGDANHSEMVFTTTYWAGSPGTSVIVPSACRPGHEVGFVFGSAVPTRARACHVALRGYAQMTALLSIADDCTDVLNDDMDCSMMRSFNERESTCVDGLAQPTACRCGGGQTQNSYNGMLSAIRACP